MKKPIFGLLLLTVVLLGGCWQKSIHPFYTASDLVSEPRLSGAWQIVQEKPPKDDRPLTWTFNRKGETEFLLVVEEDGERHEYDARVFKLGDRRYIDLHSRERAVSTVPVHHLFHLVELGAELKVTMLNEDWMRRWLRKHPASLPHIVVADNEEPDNRSREKFVLLADTKMLQNFIRDHLKDSDFFTGEIVLRKEAATGAAKKP